VSIGTWPERLRARRAAGDAWTAAWLASAVAAWETEGRLSAGEAERLRGWLREPHFQTVLPHLSMHLLISAVLIFPFASLTRAGWTLAALLTASMRLLVRRIDRHSWITAWRIHHPLVAALALVPAIGTCAYVVSPALRGETLLARAAFDAALLRVPWRLYERSRLRRLIARPAIPPVA
jgi:hypothetical protein